MKPHIRLIKRTSWMEIWVAECDAIRYELFQRQLTEPMQRTFDRMRRWLVEVRA